MLLPPLLADRDREAVSKWCREMPGSPEGGRGTERFTVVSQRPRKAVFINQEALEHVSFQTALNYADTVLAKVCFITTLKLILLNI